MGPHKNTGLYENYGEQRLEHLSREFQRRELIVDALTQLSDLFEKTQTTHDLTEPTLMPRLMALSMVQKSRMGISGFEPLMAVNGSQPNGSVEAKKAPHHDSFNDENGEYRTRVVKIVPPEHYDDTNPVEIYGLNIYAPSAAEIFDGLESSKAKLVIVGATARAQEKRSAISGEVVVFAVRNRLTGDAKVYTVEQIEETVGDGVNYIDANEATVRLRDGQAYRVLALSGELLNEAVSEFRAGGRALTEYVEDNLTEEEKLAALSSLSVNEAES